MSITFSPAEVPEQQLLRTAPRWLYAAAVTLLSLVTLALLVSGAAAVTGDDPTPDFEYFYQAGHWLATEGVYDPGYDWTAPGERRARGTIPWYLPAVSRFLALIGWLPYRVAAVVWLAVNLFAFVTIVRLLGQHVMGVPRREWPVVQLVPILLLLPAWLWEFKLNQVDTLTLLLIVAGFVHWQRGKKLPAGIWLGLATILKLTPGLIVLWFALKRQWRVFWTAVLTGLLAGPLADLAMLTTAELIAERRPPTAAVTRTVERYVGWIEHAVFQGSHRALITTGRELDWRNQSSSAVLSRWLTETNIRTTWDNDPRWVSDTRPPRYINVADLSPATVAKLQLAASVVLLLALLWLWRRPAARLTLWQLRLEFALAVLAMLWFMPVMRWYHMVFAFPAVSALAAVLHYRRFRGGWSGLALLCLLTVPTLAVLMAGDSFESPNRIAAAGGGLGATIAIGIPLVAALVLLHRAPSALRPDPLGPPHPARRQAPTAKTDAHNAASTPG